MHAHLKRQAQLVHLHRPLPKPASLVELNRETGTAASRHPSVRVRVRVRVLTYVPCVALAVPVAFVAPRLELVRDPAPSQVNVVRGIIRELLVVVDRKAPGQKAPAPSRPWSTRQRYQSKATIPHTVAWCSLLERQGEQVSSVCHTWLLYMVDVRSAYSFIRSRQPSPIHTAWCLLLERQSRTAL